MTSLLQQARALHEQGQFQQACELYSQIEPNSPDHVQALRFLGSALRSQGFLEEALRIYQHALRLYPKAAEIFFNQGNLLLEMRKIEEAIASYAQAITHQSNYAAAYCARANVYTQQGQHEEALKDYAAALTLSPTWAMVWNNQGAALEALERHEEALFSYQKALQLDPRYLDAYCNRGSVLCRLGRFEEALQSYEQVLVMDPAHAGAWCGKSMVFWTLHQYDLALQACHQALSAQPRCALAYVNQGNAWGSMRRDAEAVESYRKALEIEPERVDAHFNQSLCLLRLGRFEEGLPEYEWRWKTDHLRPHVRGFGEPLWLGQFPLQGKTILLHGEQGLGDMLQFCRYVTNVHQQGARVILEVHESLKDLLLCLSGVEQVLAKGQPLPAFDCHCPLGSLPLALGLRLETLVSSAPYLQVSQEKRSVWEQKLGPARQLRIGLAWSGNPALANAARRKIVLSDLLAHLPAGHQYISLQKEIHVAADQETVLAASNFLHFGAELTDFTDTAALVSLMDLVISVDTGIAHLAGALGKPLWVLLPWVADWRWFINRQDSPWYSSARLFRQTQDSEWGDVLLQIKNELKKKPH